MCAVLLVSGCGEYVIVSKEGSEQLFEGQRLRYYGTPAQAEPVLQQAYASPDRKVKSEAAFQLAQLAESQQQYDETVRYMEEAYRAGYEGSPVRLAKAYINASPARRNYRKAEEILKAHQQESVDSPAYLARLYVMQGQFSKALPPLQLAENNYRTLSIDPARDALQIAQVYRDIHLYSKGASPEAEDKAKQWYTLAAQRGEASAPVELAQMLMYNARPDSASYGEGMALLQTAANQNNPDAMEALGKAYYDTGQDEQALHWFVKREQLGDADGAQAYHIAKVYKRNKEQPQNLAAMETWYRKAIDKGNPEAKASWYLYQTEERQKQLVRAEHLREKQSREAERERQRQLIAVTPELEKGYAMMFDSNASKESYGYFKNLADSGDSLQAMLMVDSWKGETKNSAYEPTYRTVGPKALFKAAADNANRLGDTRKEQALRQWQLAAAHGSGDAAYQLAQYYENKPELANKWMGKAIDMGSGKAMLHKAREAAVNGTGDQADEQVFNWYRKAAESGEAEAQYQTGVMYAKGKGVAKNIQQAKYWLSKAKNNGYFLASDAITSIQ